MEINYKKIGAGFLLGVILVSILILMTIGLGYALTW